MEKTVKAQNVLKELNKIQKGDSLLVEVEGKEEIKKFQLLQYQVESLDNLFQMYVGENSEMANGENFQQFLATYSKAYGDKKKLSNKIILGALTRPIYNEVLKKGVIIKIDWEANGVIVEKG